MSFSGGHIAWLTVWMTAVVLLYKFLGDKMAVVTWVPVSVIGTAVAFYVGFKNSQSYDRLWEARKVWGAIVNSSRLWGSSVCAYVDDHFANEDVSDEEIHRIKRRLIYRHIAWLYQLRDQLLIPTNWEHVNQGFHVAKTAERRIKRFGVGLIRDEHYKGVVERLIKPLEYAKLQEAKNKATALIDGQAQDLQTLRHQNLIDDFRHIDMQKVLGEFYVHQGKCERIKKFPFPRQYGSMSAYFVGIFIFLLPFGLVPQFAALGETALWFSIPVLVAVGWVYIIMELVGDYSENPFEGLGNDIPMLSLCRTIEIDLRQMLDEEDLPPPIEAVSGVLM